MEISYSLKNVDDVAKKLIENVNSKLLLFYGDMGVGKTTLIKSIVKTLGSQDKVSSPTFSIVNEYELSHGGIYHFDLYRVKDLEDAYNFGIEDYLNSKNWILIEWPEKIEPILTEFFDIIDIKLASNNTRIISLNYKNN